MVLDFIIVHAVKVINPIGSSDISELLNKLLDGIIAFTIPLLVLFYVYLGFRFITSLGKPQEIARIRDWALYGLIGTLIIVSARGLYSFIDGTVKRITATAAIETTIPFTMKEGDGVNENPQVPQLLHHNPMKVIV